MHIRNEHARLIARPASEVFSVLEAVGTEDDRIWPAPSVPFERTPGPLRVGETRERHGIIRAVLDELDPDRKLVWRARARWRPGMVVRAGLVPESARHSRSNSRATPPTTRHGTRWGVHVNRRPWTDTGSGNGRSRSCPHGNVVSPLYLQT